MRPVMPTRQKIEHLLCAGERGRRVLARDGEPPAVKRAARWPVIAAESLTAKICHRRASAIGTVAEGWATLEGLGEIKAREAT
jgi:hypothetical protein